LDRALYSLSPTGSGEHWKITSNSGFAGCVGEGLL